jgi:flagellar motor protein MotB
MDDFNTQTAKRLIVVVLFLCAPLLSGCRQPGANPQGQTSLFNFGRPAGSGIFGSNARYADSRNSNLGQNSRFAEFAGFNTNSNFGNASYGAAPPRRGISNDGIPDLQISDGGQQFSNNTRELQNLNQRLGAFDSDNQLLNTEVAALQQKLQLANQYNQTLKEQLAGTSSQVQQGFSERQNAAQQIANLQSQLSRANQNLQVAQQQSQRSAGQLASFNGGAGAPTGFGNGGATIRANNSLLRQLSAIQIPGGEARMDGDVIRIEFPSDRMFVPGSYQIQPSQRPLLQNIVGTIRQSFPRQIIGIEAHWDNTPLNPPTTTHHQLTATQALAVFDNLVSLGLPSNQLFTMAMASNRPRHQQGTVGGISPNRRVEIVIYPEFYDGSR